MAFNPYLPFFVSIQTSITNFRRQPGSTKLRRKR
jgi:hypothetical protein